MLQANEAQMLKWRLGSLYCFLRYSLPASTTRSASFFRAAEGRGLTVESRLCSCSVSPVSYRDLGDTTPRDNRFELTISPQARDFQAPEHSLNPVYRTKNIMSLCCQERVQTRFEATAATTLPCGFPSKLLLQNYSRSTGPGLDHPLSLLLLVSHRFWKSPHWCPRRSSARALAFSHELLHRVSSRVGGTAAEFVLRLLITAPSSTRIS